MLTRRINWAILSFLLPGSSNSFFVPSPSQTSSSRLRAEAASWSPQDLTTDNDGFPPIPADDYIKQYQRNPKLWPVEFFVIAHRRNENTGQTELLVRRSANGTSEYGLGTGVPATRWILSTSNPPMGYSWSDGDDDGLPTTFRASGYPEYNAESCNNEDWTYRKIDIRDEFSSNDADLRDSGLEEYATAIRNALRERILEQRGNSVLSSWEATRLSVIQNALDRKNSIAAIQGSLRMSGLFSERSYGEERYLNLNDAPDPLELANLMRIYTMFPQMPDPMPHPSSTPQELKAEIETRPSSIAESGRNPHLDEFGRIYTHISTNNVSNTIHGIYLSMDVTGFSGLDDVPALDLFGKTRIAREWVSLETLGVLAENGIISLEDTKPTFISGFIVRQLVKEGIVTAK